MTAYAKEIEGNLKYSYMLAVNVDSLVEADKEGKPITNPKTGRYTLIREGEAMDTFHNTIVHELFHALMDDYNRTGMAGATNLDDLRVDAEGRALTEEAGRRYLALKFPSWFVEGSASSVGNVFALRNYVFQNLRRLQGADGRFGLGELNPTYTKALLLDTYVSGYSSDGRFQYNDLGFCEGGTDSNGNKIDVESSNYVTGYLATLYLCELSARYVYNNAESSVKVVDGVTTVDSDKLRVGLDNLLRWMHVENKSMDFLVDMISPNDSNGQSLYKSVDSFQDLFIKGEKNADGTFKGDDESLQFVTTLLNYLLYLDNQLPEGEHPTGSILEDFGRRYSTPLDQSKKTSSDYLKIANANEAIPSTVKSDTAGIGGGKSDPDKTEAKTPDTNEERPVIQDDPLPQAAKTATRSKALPAAQSEPTPASVAKETASAPVSTPAAASAPEASATATPEATSEAISEQEQAPEPEAAPEQEPAPETEAAPEATEAEPQVPETAPEPEPTPAPEAAPSSEPETAPAQETESVQETAPEPEFVPEPESALGPELAPEQEPAPEVPQGVAYPTQEAAGETEPEQ